MLLVSTGNSSGSRAARRLRAAHVVQADVTEPQHAAGAVRQAADRFGRLDIVVNNAGVMLLGPALQTTTGEWDRMVALNVQALLHVTHAALPHLVDAAGTSARRVADISQADGMRISERMPD
jgi:NADP-dependent 3-hydroxy acid dehydrogenase YdfG